MKSTKKFSPMKKIYLLTAAFMLLGVHACNDDKLNKINPNFITDTDYYKNENELTSAVNGAYAILQGVQLAGREYFFLHDLRSDEMTRGTGGGLETPRAELLDGLLTPGNYVAGQVWGGLYQLIHRVNAVIEKGPLAKEVSNEAIRTQRIAEAKFLRGWAYFELVSLWGQVPLYKGTSYDKSSAVGLGRATEEEIYAFIISNLNEAAADLTTIKDLSAADRGRATKEAAWAILARTYMFRGDYPAAKIALQKIIDSPSQLQLMPAYFDNFTEEGEFNKESIWEVGYANIGDNNWDNNGGNDDPSGLKESNVRSQEYSAIAWRNLIPSAKLLDEYERPFKLDVKEDPRLRENFYFKGDKFGDGTIELVDSIPKSTPKEQADKMAVVPGLETLFNGVLQKISWRKYSIMYKLNPGGYYTTGINLRIIRYAEVVLMMAECINETAGSEAEVLQYLNMTRQRASVNMPLYPTPRYPTGTQAARRLAIMHEKMVEMSGEQVRNRDILRWRKQNKLTTEPISYFSQKYQLLPLPQAEIDNNESISQADQNFGY
jgi:hypothetical protein